MLRRSRTAGMSVLLVGAVVAGCSSGDPTPTPVPEAEPGPISALWETLSAADAEMVSEELAVEERVAACMAELGFEYTPVDTGLGFDLVDPGVETGTREYAEQYGYGLSTDPDGFRAGGREEVLAGETPVDPNEAYVAAMSEAERGAYLAALWGPNATADMPDTGDGATADPADPTDPAEGPTDDVDTSCQGRARAEVAELTRWRDTAGFELAVEGHQAAYESALADPRVAEAVSAWSACLADAGYPGYDGIQEPNEAILAEVNTADADAFAGVGTDPSEDEIRAAWARVDEALATIAERERALAVADLDCQEEVGYRRLVTTIQAEHEQEFYDEHRVELEATLAAFLETQGA